MKLCIRHIITLIIASFISFTANADMSCVLHRFSDGHIVDYLYDAAGRRLGAYYLLASDDVFNDGIGVEGGGVSIQELVREWSGEFVYENGELERILTDNGYWKNGRYWFYIKDWQGNNRVTIGGISDAPNASSGGMSLNPTATLIQAKDVNVYYPYGTRFSDVFATTTDRYQYSGKEFDRMNGLDLYDFHARQYDPVLGRFTTPDPLSEKYYHLSPYAYCASNPLRYIDPTGMEIFIERSYGFLGLKKEMLRYDNGSLYTSSGEMFSGKISGFVGKVLNAISDISKTETGASLIATLSASDNSYNIKSGKNEFVAEKPNKAQIRTQNNDMLENIDNSNIGSGGTIYWNPYTLHSGPDETGQTSRPTYIGLAHELGHALSANNGTANYSKYAPNHFDYEFRKITYDEYNAIRIENKIRKEAGLHQRKYYSVDSAGGYFMPILTY